jgi:glycosyltransferase involved in cell wall biosynthesis
VTTPLASVVIATRNRRDELREAVRSALGQSVPVEVVVVDDGSTDGTPDMLAREFPDVRVHVADEPRGAVVQRNRAVAYARAPIVFGLDDDAVYTSPETVAQTLRDFEHPRVGAVAIPYVDRLRDGTVLERHRAPAADGVYVTPVFIACAFAARRDLYLRLGGMREVIFQYGEERDFCLRLLDAGYVTRLGTADPLRHSESHARDVRRMDLYGRRNDILHSWHNQPLPHAPWRMAVMSAKGMGLGVKFGRPLRMAHGLLLGYRACWAERGRRRPVAREAYRLDRRLRRLGPQRIEDVERLIPGRVA